MYCIFCIVSQCFALFWIFALFCFPIQSITCVAVGGLLVLPGVRRVTAKQLHWDERRAANTVDHLFKSFQRSWSSFQKFPTQLIIFSKVSNTVDHLFKSFQHSWSSFERHDHTAAVYTHCWSSALHCLFKHVIALGLLVDVENYQLSTNIYYPSPLRVQIYFIILLAFVKLCFHCLPNICLQSSGHLW